MKHEIPSELLLSSARPCVLMSHTADLDYSFKNGLSMNDCVIVRQMPLNFHLNEGKSFSEVSESCVGRAGKYQINVDTDLSE